MEGPLVGARCSRGVLFKSVDLYTFWPYSTAFFDRGIYVIDLVLHTAFCPLVWLHLHGLSFYLEAFLGNNSIKKLANFKNHNLFMTFYIPGPPKVCFMKVFRYIKHHKTHQKAFLWGSWYSPSFFRIQFQPFFKEPKRTVSG